MRAHVPTSFAGTLQTALIGIWSSALANCFARQRTLFKTIGTAALTVLVCLSPHAAEAAQYNATALINQISTSVSDQGTNQDWFTLVNTSGLGSCKTNGGLVLFRIKDDTKGQRQYAMLLSLKLA
jgi:hypothetical protein